MPERQKVYLLKNPTADMHSVDARHPSDFPDQAHSKLAKAVIDWLDKQDLSDPKYGEYPDRHNSIGEPALYVIEIFADPEGTVLGAKATIRVKGGSGDIDGRKFQDEVDAAMLGARERDWIHWDAHIYFDSDGSVLELAQFEYTGE